jgi:glutamate dehydrogenase (NADP+)
VKRLARSYVQQVADFIGPETDVLAPDVCTKNESRHLRAVYAPGSLGEVSGGDEIGNRELLELDVDLLVPAALEHQITAENAPRVAARTIVEVANGPIAPDAAVEAQGTQAYFGAG